MLCFDLLRNHRPSAKAVARSSDLRYRIPSARVFAENPQRWCPLGWGRQPEVFSAADCFCGVDNCSGGAEVLPVDNPARVPVCIPVLAWGEVVGNPAFGFCESSRPAEECSDYTRSVTCLIEIDLNLGIRLQIVPFLLPASLFPACRSARG